MPTDHNPDARATRLSTLAAFVVVVVGAMALFGWAFDIVVLKSILPGWVSMKANTAACFILIGIALGLTARTSVTSNHQRSILFSRFARISGLLAGLISLLTLGEYVFGWDLGIDQWLFRAPEDMVGTSHPGRMAPETALNFVLLSAALWLANGTRKTRRTILASASIGLLVAIFALTALLSYLMPGLGAYGWFGLTLMALHTATLFAMLGMAVIAISWQPDTLQWSLNGRTTAAFACGLLMLAFIGLSASRSQLYMNEMNRQIVYGEQVMSDISGLLVEVLDAQAHARGYVISGDEELKSHYLEARTNSNARLDALRKLMAGSPQRQQQFAQIEMRTNVELQWLQQSVDLERTGITAAERSKRVAHGEGLMDSLRSTLDQVANEHRQISQQLDRKAEGVDALFYRIIFFSTLVSLMVFLIVMFRLNSTINERRQADASLRNSESQLRTVIENLSEGLVVSGLDGQVLHFNRAALNLHGYTTLDECRRRLPEFADTFDLSALDGTVLPVDQWPLARVLRGENLSDMKVYIRHIQAGWKRVYSYGGTLVRDAGGQPLLAILTVSDITERKQAEEKLRESRESLNRLLNSIVEGAYGVDTNGNCTFVNPSCLRMLGYQNSDELLSKHMHTLIHHSHSDGSPYPVSECRIYRAYQSREATHVSDEVFWRKDGSSFPVEYWSSPILAGGVAIGSILTFVDITERKRVEQEILTLNAELEQRVAERTTELELALSTMRASEERFRLIAETITEVFWMADVQIEKIFYVSAAYERIWGRSLQSLYENPRSFIEAIHPDDRTRVLANLELQKTGQPFGHEYRITKPDGTLRWVWDRGFPVHESTGEILRYVGVAQDITERKQAEQDLLVAKEAAELANRAKDSFLATMSHEIRTPLTGMLGMLEMLSLTSLDRDQGETLRAVWDSSRSLLRIVNDILDWSKIVEGKLALAPQSTSIPQLLQEVVNTYSRVASAKSLGLWQHADARLSPAHIVDALRLSQILNNFVSNAIKFTQRGEIELRAELLEQVDSGERIRFSVKDTGIGISNESRQHLFQRYRQASTDTTRMYGGTGLGLAICRRLADLLDGQIELVSEPGQGSIFSFTLTLPVSGTSGELIPTLFPDVEQKKVKPLLDGSVDAPLVLAVDDHPTNRDLLERQIKLLGLRAEAAENGQEALSLWREGRFALVITDCHMPEMDGYALTQAIRKVEAEKKLPRTPIIAWTANALAEEKEHCHAAGMDELLVKPTNLAQLKKMLAKWLSLAETDSSQPAPSTHDAEGRQAAGPIDYAVLNEAVPDPAERIRALHDFQAQIRADRAKLFETMEQGDQVKVESTAHRMKGSSLMVGATELARTCAAIEQAAQDGNMGSARVARAGLDEAIKRLETYIAEAGKHEEKADEN